MVDTPFHLTGFHPWTKSYCLASYTRSASLESALGWALVIADQETLRALGWPKEPSKQSSIFPRRRSDWSEGQEPTRKTLKEEPDRKNSTLGRGDWNQVSQLHSLSIPISDTGGHQKGWRDDRMSQQYPGKGGGTWKTTMGSYYYQHGGDHGEREAGKKKSRSEDDWEDVWRWSWMKICEFCVKPIKWHHIIYLSLPFGLVRSWSKNENPRNETQQAASPPRAFPVSESWMQGFGALLKRDCGWRSAASR